MDQSLKRGRNSAGSNSRPDWVVFALREMAQAMGDWLIANNDLNKPVHRLGERELMGMSWAAMAKYTDLREIERKRLGIAIFDESALDDAGFVITQK